FITSPSVALGRPAPVLPGRSMDELTQAPKSHRGTDPDASGSSCVTLAVVTVRQEDSLSSQILGHFNVGSQLKVLQLSNAKPGELLRAEVKSASMQGWITVRNTGGQALVGMEANKVSRSTRLEDVMKGSQLETLRLMTLRAGEALSSECVGQLPPHTRITVLEVLAEPQGALRRAKISTLESSQCVTQKMGRTVSTRCKTSQLVRNCAICPSARPFVKSRR
ncbi:unnamed protein product, partial [Durusdinium trenchii]